MRIQIIIGNCRQGSRRADCRRNVVSGANVRHAPARWARWLGGQWTLNWNLDFWKKEENGSTLRKMTWAIIWRRTKNNHSDIMVNMTLSSFIQLKIFFVNVCSLPSTVQRLNIHMPCSKGHKQCASKQRHKATLIDAAKNKIK